MAVNSPDLTGDTTGGVIGGVPGGSTTTPGGLPGVAGSPAAAALPTSPQSLLKQRWRPGSFMNIHNDLMQPMYAVVAAIKKALPDANIPDPQTLVNQAVGGPASTARNLDQAIRLAYTNAYTLESQIASTQFGSATITGSKLAIPTGLLTVKQVTGTIDAGATAHNFTLSVTPSATPGAIDIRVWQPTAAGNTTPTAGTTAVLVRWSATGSLSS